MGELSRRQFVGDAAKRATAVAAACCVSCASSGPGGAPAAGGPVDVGALGQYATAAGAGEAAARVVASFVERGHFLLVREGDRLYAVSSICTHRACDVAPAREGGREQLVCPCHDSEFTLQGVPKTGPARRALPRLGVSVDARTRVIVDPSQQFAPEQWGDPRCYVLVGDTGHFSGQ